MTTTRTSDLNGICSWKKTALYTITPRYVFVKTKKYSCRREKRLIPVSVPVVFRMVSGGKRNFYFLRSNPFEKTLPLGHYLRLPIYLGTCKRPSDRPHSYIPHFCSTHAYRLIIWRVAFTRFTSATVTCDYETLWRATDVFNSLISSAITNYYKPKILCSCENKVNTHNNNI